MSTRNAGDKQTIGSRPPNLPKELWGLFEREPELRDLFQEILEEAPVFLDRRAGAELLSAKLFPVSHRAIANWGLPTRRACGRAVFPTLALLEAAFLKLASPVVVCGHKTEDRLVAA
jgi:hypothetical protein